MLSDIKNKNIHIVISSILILFFLRLYIPQYVKYILFPEVILFFMYSIIILIRNFNLKSSFDSKLKVFTPVVITSFSLVFSLIISNSYSLYLLKESINLILLFIFLISILITSFTTDFYYKYTFYLFIRYSFVLGSIMAFFGIIKLLLQLYGIRFYFLHVPEFGYPLATSLSVDDNFFTLACIISILFSIPFFIRTYNLFKRISLQFALFILLISIFLSTSRRGLIIATFLLFLLFLVVFISLVHKNDIFKKLRNNTLFVIFSFSLIVVSYYIFTFRISPLIRSKWLANSSLNQKEVNSYLNLLTYKGKSLFEGELTYDETKYELWKTKFDSKLPYSGWAEGNFKIVNNLSYLGLSDVPFDAQGAFIKNDISNNFISNDTAFYSSTITEVLDKNNTMLLSTINCFVSDDFNGSTVRLVTHGYTSGLRVYEYDLTSKNKWQKLYNCFIIDSSHAITKLEIKTFGVSKFKNLNGYIIIAYPELHEISFNPSDPRTWSSIKYIEIEDSLFFIKNDLPKHSRISQFNNKSIFYLNSKGDYYLKSDFPKQIINNNNNRYLYSLYCKVNQNTNVKNVKFAVSGNVHGSVSSSYDIRNKGKWQKLFLNFFGDSGYVKPFLYFEIDKDISSKLNGSVEFAYPHFTNVINDPKEPISFSCNPFILEYPLIGKDSSIVPQGTKGYRLDKSTYSRVYNNMAYSSTMFSEIKAESGDSVYASVYCYVSTDYNGGDVRLELRCDLDMYKYIHYNLSHKGKWIKLEKSFVVDNPSLIGGVLYFSKPNSSDFSNLIGHVTFAYPELKIVRKRIRPVSFNGIKANNLVFNRAIFSPAFIFTKIAGFSSIISVRDSTNVNYEFKKELINDHFSGPRVDRWRYALHLYRYEYKWWQKIIGGGFGYTKKFAETFSTTEKKIEFDYPHNPFLSVLLYSGIIGLAVYIWFLVNAVYYYWIYRREYWTLGFAFGVTFFFAFFSGNSPFDPAILGIFSILPYFIHYYNLKDQKTTNE